MVRAFASRDRQCITLVIWVLLLVTRAPVKRKLKSGAPRAEIDAFKLWLGFIDHGDTKADNQKFACLDSMKSGDGSRVCKPGQAVYYVSDMGSTFGYSSAREKTA